MDVARALRWEFNRLKSVPVVGNAYHDHDLLNLLPSLALAACRENDPDLAFEALDYLGSKVMGLDPLKWDDPRDSFEVNMLAILEVA